ncbi:ATP synthase F0 subunit B [Candidatus Berkelbacteria bacterium]|nr:ATP synthase F0 subunit B [Candidatus Berkelbacteria bacterium]
MINIEPTAGIAAIGIDARLIGAQIINFLIVFAAVKFLAVKPIVVYLGERRKRISDSMKNAQAIEDEKRKLEEKIEALMVKTRAQALNIMSEAKTQAARLRQETQEELKREHERALAEAKEEIAQESAKSLEESKKHLGYLAIKLAERISETKLTPAKDDALIAKLLKEVK